MFLIYLIIKYSITLVISFVYNLVGFKIIIKEGHILSLLT